MARIYVASSWRNSFYPEVVERLRQAGHEVYDFRNPPHGGNGFRWTDIDKNAPNWTFKEYEEGLSHPLAERQFKADIDALNWADACVLVLPCGRSAHTEAGWMRGAGKSVTVYIPEMQEPELMYKLFDNVVGSIDDLIKSLSILDKASRPFSPVDLGLSVLWAERNLGAVKESDYGHYCGWKGNYGKWKLTDRGGHSRIIPIGWRLPTWDESLELLEHSQWTYSLIDNHYGAIATGPSGQSIFLPFGGYTNENDKSKVWAEEGCGLFLTRTIKSNNCTFLIVGDKEPYMQPRGDIDGYLSVRLVKEK